MIKFSNIDDELNVYKGRKVILFGAGKNGLRIKKELAEGVKIDCFCDSDASKWGRIIEGLPVISPSQLYENYDEKMLIQISSVFSKEIEMQLHSYHINSYISYEEYCMRMRFLYIYKNFSQYMKVYQTLYSEPSYTILQSRERCLEYAAKVKFFDLDSYNIVCLPPKTGNYTLETSLQKYQAEYVRIGHCFDRISPELNQFIMGKKIKIVTAVRDPIAQNVSFFFQLNTRFCDIQEYWKDGGDVQILWDAWIAHVLGKKFRINRKSAEIRFEYMDYINQLLHNVICIQNFFEENFEKYNHINVYDYPFDRKKGYSIIKDRNTEVFIYQLEKLNEIQNDLGQFLGIEDFRLTNDNVGSEKWYAPAYQQALKELKFSREYFEYCYDSKLVKHFYSEEDIDRFKCRWSKNIDE